MLSTSFLYQGDFNDLKAKRPDAGADDSQILIEISWPGCQRGSVVFTAAVGSGVDPGKVALNGSQREDVFVTLDKLVTVKPFRCPATSAIQTINLTVDLKQTPASDAPFLEVLVHGFLKRL